MQTILKVKRNKKDAKAVQGKGRASQRRTRRFLHVRSLGLHRPGLFPSRT